jgi:hypothetical protein
MLKRIESIALSNEFVESPDQTTKAKYIEMMIKKVFHFSEEVQKKATITTITGTG